MKILVATQNKEKLAEIGRLLKGLDIDILGLNAFPDIKLPEEEESSFRANALKKARYAARFTDLPVVADDSGLVIEALGGRPGIKSARYASKDATDEENIEKVLTELKGVPLKKRKAYFICVIALILPSGKEEIFEGRCNGIIGTDIRGRGGFGYDPIFYLPELGLTMAELIPEDKNRISHRGKAIKKLRKKLSGILKDNYLENKSPL